jgi:hypothetical protein
MSLPATVRRRRTACSAANAPMLSMLCLEMKGLDCRNPFLREVAVSATVVMAWSRRKY